MPTDKRQRKKQGRQARLEELRAQQARERRRKRMIAGVGVVVVISVVAAFFVSGDDDAADDLAAGNSTTTSPEEGGDGPPKGEPVPPGEKLDEWKCPAADGSSPRTDQFPDEPPPMCIDPAKSYVAKLATSHGPIEITLDTQKTPNTANNFVVLSRYHYYDGTVITRIDDSIDILQTGSPKTQTISDPGPGYNIKDEGAGFTYKEGDVVMARGQGADSGSAQYFFVTGPKASALDSQGTYVTFGKVTTGLEVTKEIAGLFEPCGEGDQTCLGGAPGELVTIEKIEIEER